MDRYSAVADRCRHTSGSQAQCAQWGKTSDRRRLCSRCIQKACQSTLPLIKGSIRVSEEFWQGSGSSCWSRALPVVSRCEPVQSVSALTWAGREGGYVIMGRLVEQIRMPKRLNKSHHEQESAAWSANSYCKMKANLNPDVWEMHQPGSRSSLGLLAKLLMAVGDL